MKELFLCSSCHEHKDCTEFSKNAGRFNGLSSYCKPCASAKLQDWRSSNLKEYLLQRAKYRAKIKKIPIDIGVEDITIPEYCPVFGMRLSVNGNKDSSPSIDRIDNNQGYTKNNIRVISYRANMLRHTGTLDEFEKLVKYLKEN